MAVRIDRLLDPFDNSMSCLDLSESLAFRKRRLQQYYVEQFYVEFGKDLIRLGIYLGPEFRVVRNHTVFADMQNIAKDFVTMTDFQEYWRL
ncbi:hypothetical protein AVEN_108886-1 [Araneus ventricosus]|uniref:Uncharacterized protein n=1 Tax=Araneus ventricosus TaxID=182803 RepID=A0A4Y2SRE1_ARAVE|nr:hypothetical protein AVEN_108886-1 [Araneus ventricosus]